MRQFASLNNVIDSCILMLSAGEHGNYAGIIGFTMEVKRETLPITVDKSHLITIGEKLYTQSIELIRELVNNAYDADASVVEVDTAEDKIVIKVMGAVWICRD